MPDEGRASGNCPERSFEELERSGVACAAGHALLLEFKLDRPGRFIALRGGVRIGGIDFKEGGWFPFEYRKQRAVYGVIGRCRAHFAACDMWGALAGSIVARMPEHRPPEPPQEQPAKNVPRESDHAATR